MGRELGRECGEGNVGRECEEGVGEGVGEGVWGGSVGGSVGRGMWGGSVRGECEEGVRGELWLGCREMCWSEYNRHAYTHQCPNRPDTNYNSTVNNMKLIAPNNSFMHLTEVFIEELFDEHLEELLLHTSLI